MNWERLGLTVTVLLALVGLAVGSAYLPALQNVYSQVAAALLGLLGVHHGHDLLSKKLDDGDTAETPAPDSLVSAVAAATTTDAAVPAAASAPPQVQVEKVAAPDVPEVTAAVLAAVMPHAGPELCREHAPLCQAAVTQWGIDTKARLAMFLGNCALECDELRHLEEEWGPSKAQEDYEPPHHVAKVLGNVNPGDGRRYMGRGVIQLTGRSNYRQAGRALGLKLEAMPGLAAQPGVAWLTAGWFWDRHGLNDAADAGDFERTVQVINGGLTDLERRRQYYRRALQALS